MLGEDAITTYSHSMDNHLIILSFICQWILAFFPRLVPRFFVFMQRFFFDIAKATTRNNGQKTPPVPQGHRGCVHYSWGGSVDSVPSDGSVSARVVVSCVVSAGGVVASVVSGGAVVAWVVSSGAVVAAVVSSGAVAA